MKFTESLFFKFGLVLCAMSGIAWANGSVLNEPGRQFVPGSGLARPAVNHPFAPRNGKPQIFPEGTQDIKTIQDAGAKYVNSRFAPAGCEFVPGYSNNIRFWMIEYDLRCNGLSVGEAADHKLYIGSDGKLMAADFENLPKRVESSTPALNSEEAVQTAIKQFSSANSVGTPVASTPGLRYVVDKDGVARLFWDLQVRNQNRAMPSSYHYLVGANAPGEIYFSQSIFN